MRTALWLLGLGLLLAGAIFSEDKWADIAELQGDNSKAVNIEWTVIDLAATNHELAAVWKEKPSQARVWKLLNNNAKLTVTPLPAPVGHLSATQFSVNVSFPGAGHFAFSIKSCNTENVCVTGSSLDIATARVSGQPRTWLVYKFALPPGQPVPLDNPAPVVEHPKVTQTKM